MEEVWKEVPGFLDYEDKEGDAREDYFEILTTLFVPKENGKGHHSIQFYCRYCGDELHGVRHFDVYPPHVQLECHSCDHCYDWLPRGQQEAEYELRAAWDELWRIG